MNNSATLLPFLLLLLVICGCYGRPHKHKKNSAGIKKSVTPGTNWDVALPAFRETVIQDFLHGDLDSSPQEPINSAVEWIYGLLKRPAPGQKSQWEQWEDKLNKKSRENMDDTNVRMLSDDFDKLVNIMEKAKKKQFNQSDVSMIRAAYPNFFPQSYPRVNFTVKWLSTLTKYMTIVAAGYIDLTKRGEVDDCKLAEQLNMFKPLILDAAKKLAKSRYESLQKVAWSGGSSKFKTTASLSFLDEATGKLFEDIPLTQLPGRLFTPMKEQMADFMMKHLVDNFNGLYNETWAGHCSSQLPEIRLQDLEVEFPHECFDGDGICEVPCGRYNRPHTWCSNSVRFDQWQTRELGVLWQDCKPADWDKCIYIGSEQMQPVVVLENNTEGTTLRGIV